MIMKKYNIAIIGAGAVVTKNNFVPSGATVIGVPARILKKNKRSGR